MHTATTVKLGCIDCHGGKVEVRAPEGAAAGSPAYEAAKKQAHVLPKNTEVWRTSANPTHSYTAILQESQEFVQFVNPGDLRVARRTCGPGGCHPTEVAQVEKSMMKTGPMLWAAALYNNGGFPLKRPRFGEAYGPDGLPQRVLTLPPPTRRGDGEEGRAGLARPAAALRGGPAGQRAARVRARPGASARDRRAHAQRAAGQAGQPAQPARARHPQPHRSGVAELAEDAAVRSRRCRCSATTSIPASSAPAGAPAAT